MSGHIRSALTQTSVGIPVVDGELVRCSLRPVILAGGLTPANVRQAIKAVCPAAVDVAEAPVRQTGPGWRASQAGNSSRGAGERKRTLWTSAPLDEWKTCCRIS